LQNGAWLGYVGVELLDDVAIFLFDDAALELHGERQTAVIVGEVFGQQGEALDGFPLREVSGEAGYFVFDEFVNPRVGDHLFV